MYKKIFTDYLNSININGVLSSPIEYILKNQQANYIRPSLVLVWTEIFNGNINEALPLAMAIECLHVASLIHDDLPCMDNAIERRGLQCLHLKFNEEIAILSGDGLISLAFQFICNSNLNDSNKIKALQLLAKMFYDICLGQTLDLQNNPKNQSEWIEIHKLKTGSLIACACGLGAICANASEEEIKEAIDFGYALGINYQIYDDIKDNDGLCNYDNSNIIFKNNEIINKYQHNFLNQLKEKIC